MVNGLKCGNEQLSSFQLTNNENRGFTCALKIRCHGPALSPALSAWLSSMLCTLGSSVIDSLFVALEFLNASVERKDFPLSMILDETTEALAGAESGLEGGKN